MNTGVVRKIRLISYFAYSDVQYQEYDNNAG
jgi:hypothetical protein